MPYMSDEQFARLMAYAGSPDDAADSGETETGNTLSSAGTMAAPINPYVGAGLKAAGLGLQVVGALDADQQARRARAEEQRRYQYGLDRSRVAGFMNMRQARTGERANANTRNRQAIVDLLDQYARTHGGQ